MKKNILNFTTIILSLWMGYSLTAQAEPISNLDFLNRSAQGKANFKCSAGKNENILLIRGLSFVNKSYPKITRKWLGLNRPEFGLAAPIANADSDEAKNMKIIIDLADDESIHLTPSQAGWSTPTAIISFAGQEREHFQCVIYF